MSWARKYIGTIPENCWLFVREIYKTECGFELPPFAHIMVGDIAKIVKTMELESVSPNWIKKEKPFEFSVVAMSKSEAIHHVGVFTEEDGGKIVHAYEGTAVVANDLLQLRRTGFKRIEYYDLSIDSYIKSV